MLKHNKLLLKQEGNQLEIRSKKSEEPLKSNLKPKDISQGVVKNMKTKEGLTKE